MGNRIRPFLGITSWIVLLSCLATVVAFAQGTATPHQDDIVVFKSLGADVESRGSRLPAGKWFQVYRVREVQGERVLVSAESGYPTGWVNSDEIVALQKANDYFSERIRLDSGSAQAYALRGSVRVYLGEFTNGIYDLIQARQLDPDLPLVYMSLGLVRLKRGDYEGTVSEFDEAIRLDPSSAPAHLLRGQIHLHRNRLDRALADLTEAIRLEPANGYLYSKRAVVWRALSENDRALVDFEAGIRLAPGSPWAHFDHGTILSERGEYKHAVGEFDEAIKLDAHYHEAFTGRAIAKMNSGELFGALKDSNEALRIAPKSSLALGVRGAIWWQEGDLDRAIEDLNESLALDPFALTSFFIRGICWDQSGKLDLAIADFSAVLSYDRKNAMARCMLARSLARKGDFAKARAHLDDAIGQSPDFGRGYLERAYLSCATREYDRAISDLDVAARKDPSLEESVAAQRSWIRATCPDSKHRDGQQAIEDAQRVLKTTRESQALNDEIERVGSILMATALAEAGDFDSAIIQQQKAIQIYKRERSGNRLCFQIDGLAWLEKVMKSFESHKAYREEPADADFLKMPVRQPTIRTTVKLLQRAADQ